MLHLATARKMLETYFRGNTFNIKFLDSEEFRKIKAVLIFEINDMEIYV